ncbi:MAG TPA: hypothetical protein VF979_02540, partial [Streptosporangiaceae bacterium]
SPAGRAGLLRRTAPQVALPDEAETADWEMPSNGRHAAGNGYHGPDEAYEEPTAVRRGAVPGRPQPDDDYGARTRHGRRRRRVPIVTTVLVVFVLLVVGGLYGSWRYVQGQYYLGIEHGNMAIFRGVNTSVAGMSLHSPYQRSNVPVAQLPATARLALSQTISSKGLGDAQSMVKSVQSVVGQCRTQWQQLATWKTANDAYQVKLTAYNVVKAHLRPREKAPKPPVSPGPQPAVPEAGSCGPASAFGIATSALPPGTSGSGAVTSPGTTPSSTTPSSTPTTPAGKATATPSGGRTGHPTTTPTTLRPTA